MGDLSQMSMIASPIPAEMVELAQMVLIAMTADVFLDLLVPIVRQVGLKHGLSLRDVFSQLIDYGHG